MRLIIPPSFLLEIPLIHVHLALFPGPGKEANVHHAHLVHSTVPVGYFHCLVKPKDVGKQIHNVIVHIGHDYLVQLYC